MFKKLKPIFVENSAVPVVLSHVAPIQIGAITMGFIVFSRGKMSPRLKRHETIHFQQFLETLFIGFVILYLWDWLINLVKYRNGKQAYYMIRAEIEAYQNDDIEDYLENRPRFKWLSGAEP